MKEIWKNIKGFEGLYQVSNLGRVKALKRVIKRKDAHGGVCVFRYKERILKITTVSQGYGTVSLTRGSGHHRVHRLVAEAFIPNPDNKPMINHIDGNRMNNKIENLEWCTNRENQIHAVKVLKRPQGAYQNKPVKCVETGRIFDNSCRAAEYLGEGKQVANRIRMVANGYYGRKSCCGYHWKFV